MNNMLALLASLKSNPMQFLNARGVNIPQNINTPDGIIQHLLNTGQISQQQLNNIVNLRNNPQIKNMFGMEKTGLKWDLIFS